MDRRIDDDTVDGDADLALMHELADHRRPYGPIDVSVIEHHKGTVAAEFQCHWLDMFSADRPLGDLSAHLGGTGEGDKLGEPMSDQRVAELAASTNQNTEEPLRQPRFLVKPCQQQSTGQGGIAGRLEHHGVTQRKGGADGALGQVEGKVPGTDHANHAQRLAIDPMVLARDARSGSGTLHASGHGGGFERHLPGIVPLEFGLDASAARLADEPLDQFILALFHQFGDTAQYSRSVGSAGIRPLPLRSVGRIKGTLDVGAICLGDLHQLFLVVGVHHLERLAGTSSPPFTGDRLQMKILEAPHNDSFRSV